VNNNDSHFIIAPKLREPHAVLFSGNGFRAIGVIAALEEDLGRPVLTANQALLWSALNTAGAPVKLINGYGRIFAVAP